MGAKTPVRRRGLQTRGKFLVVLIPMLIISMAVMTFLSIYFVRKSTRTALEESLRETVEIAASRVSDRARADISLATSIASRVGLLYADSITSPYNKAEAEKFEGQMAELGNAYGFMHMYVIDGDGYARTAVHSNIKEADPAFYAPVAAGAASCTTSPTLDTGKFVGKYKMNVAVPVKNGDGDYIGMLVCLVDAGELSDLVADIKVGEGGSTFIMDSDGRCIAHSDPDMLYGGEQFQTMEDNPEYAGVNRLWDEMRERGSGYTSYEYGGWRLAAYTDIENSDGWVLAVTASESEFMDQTNKAVLASLLTALVLVLLCGGVIIKFLNHISRRIGDVTCRLEAMASGKLDTADVRVQTTDEIGRLEAASNKLSADLRIVIDNINACLDEISSGNLLIVEREPLNGDFAAIDEAVAGNKRKLSGMITDISRTAEEVSRGSAQMANGASALAQGASEQASSVEELFTSVNDVAQKAEELGGRRATLIDAEDDLPDGDTSSGGDSLTEKLALSMARITEASAAIRRVAADIDALASETGMLALNASVEATHAGEYGRGFAVIAAEIRALSEKSRGAARSADKLIDGIMRAVERGNRTVDFTVDSVEEMVASIAQFRNALEQISNVIESTAATAEETASGSEELSAQADLLRDMISGFTYEKDDNGEWEQ